jgi:hypothetical protein
MRSERGQAIVLSVVALTSLMGMSAFVVDAGSWFRTHRQMQLAADAAALAGAQALPQYPDDARSLAEDYAETNNGSPTEVDFSSAVRPNDTISVRSRAVAPGFFSRVLGFDSITVSAAGSARAAPPAAARYVAPFGVDRAHSLLSGGGCPCWDESTSLDLKKTGPGAFRVLNLDGSRGGIGQQTLAGWILEGYDGLMDLGWYYSDPGAKFNPSEVQDALDARIGDEVLFPVYDDVRGSGSNFEYHVVGFVGFLLSGYDARGTNGLLFGSFTTVTWEGVQSESASDPDFGAHVISLVA